MQYVQGPKMDWTEDAGLHQRFKDWREEVELLMDTVLSHIKNADTKMKFVTLWAGKEARTYLNTLEQDDRDSLKTILDSLEEWTKPKSDEIAAFTHLRALNQGNKTLSSYIQEVRRVVDLCNFSCVGDCKDRLIRNSIVAGLSSTKAYQQCISKGSNLTLNECIRICQTEDATHRQVQALRPESTDCNDSTLIHHITELPQVCPRTSFRGCNWHAERQVQALRPESTDCNDSTPIHHITELPQACISRTELQTTSGGCHSLGEPQSYKEVDTGAGCRIQRAA